MEISEPGAIVGLLVDSLMPYDGHVPAASTTFEFAISVSVSLQKVLTVSDVEEAT